MKLSNAVRHAFDITLLAAIIIFGLGGILFYRFDPAAQIAVVLLMCTLYVAWGTFHHWHEQNLLGKIVLEYVSVSALVAFILIIFLLRV